MNYTEKEKKFIDRQIAEQFEKAKECLVKEKYFIPLTLFLVEDNNKNLEVINIPGFEDFYNEAQTKNILVGILKSMIKNARKQNIKVLGILLLTEAWIAEHKDPNDKTAPADDPDKKEGLLLQIHLYHEYKLCQQIFRKDLKNNVIFSKEKEFINIDITDGERFSNLFATTE